MRTVLVAGGATGIGAAATRALRQRGDRVLLADLNDVAAKAVVSEDLPGPAEFVHCDFSAPDAAATVVASAAEFGGGELDTLFYNAAILEAHPLAEWTVEAWDRSCAVNLRAPFLLAQAAAPRLAASGRCRIIFTSSTGAFRGHAGMPAYHATKAGLLGLVRALADELGPQGTTVNALCPGWVDTPFNDAFWSAQADPEAAEADLTSRIPLRRQAEPSEISGLVLFLASADSGYITGQALVVDGGYTAV
jgi:dihydroanticapsin dehydrogenase